MKKQPLNPQYILKTIDSCIEAGFRLKEELDNQQREALKAAEQSFDNEFARQEASNQHQLHYEEAMEEWFSRVEDELKKVVENFDWLQVFGEGLTSIESHINKLYELEGKYRQKMPLQEGEKELTIDTKRWILTNNRNGKSCFIGGTECQYFLTVVLSDNGIYKAMGDFLNILQKINSSQVTTAKDALDLSGRFKKTLKDKLDVSEHFIASFIQPSKGFSANMELVEIK